MKIENFTKSELLECFRVSQDPDRLNRLFKRAHRSDADDLVYPHVCKHVELELYQKPMLALLVHGPATHIVPN